MPSEDDPPAPPPQDEQDLAGAHRWNDDDDEEEHLDPSNKKAKAKGKAKANEAYLEEDDVSVNATYNGSTVNRYNLDGDEDEQEDGEQEYPPVAEDEAETRRIEENLKRWEVAERMKRKAARESAYSDPQAPTLLSSFTRRASLLWTGNNGPAPRNNDPSLGAHTALNSQDESDVVPLDDIAVTPTPSPTRSEFSNPFTSAQGPGADPFSDAEAVMSPMNEPPLPTPPMEDGDAIALQPQRPAMLTASSSMSVRRPPTPKPLGLPPPRVPPPPLPHSSPPPVPVPNPNDDEEPKVRWWHDWLCGLGEGPDRGGDHQAGRTNPFE
ncbi:hypothetical protein K438DRAFT_2011601 [Mycena galopus ATCC 62051]|nr:hypothetical protein K438DRAFT_2011601 [Mycena galopus ATCC 62051]